MIQPEHVNIAECYFEKHKRGTLGWIHPELTSATDFFSAMSQVASVTTVITAVTTVISPNAHQITIIWVQITCTYLSSLIFLYPCTLCTVCIAVYPDFLPPKSLRFLTPLTRQHSTAPLKNLRETTAYHYQLRGTTIITFLVYSHDFHPLTSATVSPSINLLLSSLTSEFRVCMLTEDRTYTFITNPMWILGPSVGESYF